LRTRVAAAVGELKARHGLTPGLAVVLVGEDPASQVYVRNKARQTVEVGMNSWEHRLDAATPEADLLKLLDQLNNDPAVHAILVQLPLPKHMIDADKVINAPCHPTRTWTASTSSMPAGWPPARRRWWPARRSAA
jgi:methylenetetrahydrofolate dehydrogenase (NADP+) / methenyltetrahydrofolate cyclohydrolase